MIARLFRRLPDRSAGLQQLPAGMVQPMLVSPREATTELVALGISPFRRGLGLISRTIGMLPVEATRDGVRVSDDPMILRRPCPWETRQTTVTSMVRSLIVHGNYVALVGDVGPDGWPQSILPVQARNTAVTLTPEGLVYRVVINGTAGYYRSVDVMHLKAPLMPGELVGRGVLADGDASLTMATAVDAATSNYYTSGVYPSGVLKSAIDLEQDEVERTRAQWVARVRRNEPVVLPPDLDWTPMGSPSAEAQQLSLASTMSREQIADLLDLDADWLGAAKQSLTYANVVDRLANLIRLTLQPWIVTIEDGLSDLLPRGVSARLSLDALQRGQVGDRYAAYATAIAAGWLLPDEAREAEGLEPLAQELTEPPELIEGAE
jgi:HK97 family phage portal protein